MSDEPTKKQQPDTFKQHYAGTSIAKQPAQHNAVDSKNKAAHAEPTPTEVAIRAWKFIIEPKHSNAIMAIFTVLIFLTGVGYTVFAGLQWRIMNRTLAMNRPWIDPTRRTIYHETGRFSGLVGISKMGGNLSPLAYDSTWN